MPIQNIFYPIINDSSTLFDSESLSTKPLIPSCAESKKGGMQRGRYAQLSENAAVGGYNGKAPHDGGTLRSESLETETADVFINQLVGDAFQVFTVRRG